MSKSPHWKSSYAEPDWATAPDGEFWIIDGISAYILQDYSAGGGERTRYNWRSDDRVWHPNVFTKEGFESDKKFMRDRQAEGHAVRLKRNGEKYDGKDYGVVATPEFEEGDEVSVTGKVSGVSELGVIYVKFQEGSEDEGSFKPEDLTLVKKAEKPIAFGTQVTDSHGCVFIMADNNVWIRIKTVEAAKPIGTTAPGNTPAGQALTKIARKK